jgi:hypothetical protein
MNGNFGLGNESEEGLDAFNKLIRYYHAQGSRTTSTEANFTVTYNHLWRMSSPLIAQMERDKRKRKPKLKILTEIEALVEQFFTEEESFE